MVGLTTMIGDWFSGTLFGKGLEALRKLYGGYGYINFVGTPNPSFDEAKHTINLNIDCEEGKPGDGGAQQPYAHQE